MTVIRGVAGRCPSCWERSLHLLPDDHVHCLNRECRAPDAVDRLLEEETEPVHVLSVTVRDWTLQHPLVERLSRNGLRCAAHHRASSTTEPVPREPGRYVMVLASDGWTFFMLPGERDGDG
jgi:hypothetical protein